MAEISIASGASKPTRTALRLQGIGVIDENFSFAGTTTSGAPNTQRVYGALLGLRAGDSVAGIALRLSQAAVGTPPSLARFGIADSSGKILAVSNDLGAASNWTLGGALFPFASPYVVVTDGSYYACFVVNGTWGSTQASLAAAAVAGTGAQVAFAGGSVPSFTWDTQTDLPAVNSSLTMTALQASRYMAFYGTAVSA